MNDWEVNDLLQKHGNGGDIRLNARKRSLGRLFTIALIIINLFRLRSGDIY